jgi:uncharacterized protein (TIGR02246 family)
MAVQDPNQAHQAWGDAFNRGDIEALLALHAPDAILVAQPGQQVSGTEGIRAALQGFLSLKAPIQLETLSVVMKGDTALTRGRWTLHGTGADGQPLEMGGDTAEIWERQPDGNWLSVIDNPWTT